MTVISLVLITGIDQLQGNLLTLFKNNTGLSGSDCDLEREELQTTSFLPHPPFYLNK